MIPDRINPRVAGSILSRLVSASGPRNAVLAELAASIRFADRLDARRWAVTLTDTMVRLNVGWVETFAVFGGCAHVVCRHDRLPQQLVASGRIEPSYKPGGIYARWAPESCCIDVAMQEAAELLPLLRPAHEAMIQDAVRSPMPASTRKAHSPGVIDWLDSRLAFGLTQPSYTLSSMRRETSHSLAGGAPTKQEGT